MFYSHQLLARKTPLGQIWMAATLHAKMNRKKLNKLNIIKICEEILNPSVPMALRLSGILMGGVVIVYERKVKMLYDDVNRLLLEINEAWKVKAVRDPTMLPKGKAKARVEAVTLPENQEADLGEIERPLNSPNASFEFQRTEYFSMRLDDVGESFYTNNMGNENFHQADPADITTNEQYYPYQANTDFANQFERFDIDGYDDTQVNFTSAGHTEMPTLVPSPPLQDKLPKAFYVADDIQDQHPEQGNQQSDGLILEEKPKENLHTRSGKRRTKSRTTCVMDHHQTMIPGPVFQTWLQSASDVVGRKRKRPLTDAVPNIKLSFRMELPPIVILCRLFTNGNQEIYYPAPLLEQWMRSTQPPQDARSGKTSPPQPPEPASSSVPTGVNYHSPMRYPAENIDTEFDPRSFERMMSPVEDVAGIPVENVVGLGATDSHLGKGAKTNGTVTPGNSGDDVWSIHSIGSGNSLPSFTSHVSSGRLNKKRPHSLSGQDGFGLEPVTEENPLIYEELNVKLARLHESGKSPENDFLAETGPTQTQKAATNHPVDKITDSLRTQWKTHFDTPGAHPTESLSNLTSGTSRMKAARFFYQTCVLASLDFLRVEQKVPYGDILISRGGKM